MPHHTQLAPPHSHGGSGNTAAAHGFITLHPVATTKTGQGVAKVNAQNDPGVSASPCQNLVVAYVEDTQNRPMNDFHLWLDTLANKYVALLDGGASLFNFEHHF